MIPAARGASGRERAVADRQAPENPVRSPSEQIRAAEGHEDRAIVNRPRHGVRHDAAVHHVDEVRLELGDALLHPLAETPVDVPPVLRPGEMENVHAHAGGADALDLGRDERAGVRNRRGRIHVRNDESAHVQRPFARAGETGAPPATVRRRRIVGETFSRKRARESAR
jgi:hypothetical protein